MVAPLLRRVGVSIATLAVVGGAAAAVAPAASAADPVFTGGQVAVGDVTGDGIADRIALGSIHKASGDVCAYRLLPGLGQGRFGAPVVHTLPLWDHVPAGQTESCPDLGAVVPGPSAASNRLAVAWSLTGPAGDGPSVQLFRGFGGNVYFTGGFDGIDQPTVIGSQDFDGDGRGDVWEQTDQGSGFVAWVGRGTAGWVQLYATPFTVGASPQFFDLNHAGGTDILVSWSNFTAGAGVAAVDGRTGAVQVLGSSDADSSTFYSASVVDLDHDDYPDLQVVVDPGNGTAPTVQRFLNRSQGGRWYFQPLPTT